MSATISIVVPAHNALDTIGEALSRLAQIDFEPLALQPEVIVVDDASTDGTTRKLEAIATTGSIRLCVHPEHLGHGAAVSTGIAVATGQIVLVADATLAYAPEDSIALLGPIANGDADIVYGSRYAATVRQVPRLWDRVSDRILTAASNGFANVALSDATTSFVAFRTDVVRGAVFRADGVAVAAEIAALASARQCRIFEVPVAHRTRPATAPRTRWIDGLSHLTMAARCAFRDWQLRPVEPHRPFRSPVVAATRSARLTRLVRPMDVLPMPSAMRPTLRPH
jgi:glycosyltransferase involved in cell wall biosynthesis